MVQIPTALKDVAIMCFGECTECFFITLIEHVYFNFAVESLFHNFMQSLAIQSQYIECLLTF